MASTQLGVQDKRFGDTFSAEEFNAVKTLLNLKSDDTVFTSTRSGIVPPSGGNPSFFLSADGTFKQISTSGLQPANNLSDLLNVSTARTNLGLGPLAVATSVGTANIADKAVTIQKLADFSSAGFLGRAAAGAGAPQVLSIAAAQTALNMGALAQKNTITSIDINNGAVTLQKIESIAGQTIIGNIGSSLAAPSQVTISSLRTALGLPSNFNANDYVPINRTITAGPGLVRISENPSFPSSLATNFSFELSIDSLPSYNPIQLPNGERYTDEDVILPVFDANGPVMASVTVSNLFGSYAKTDSTYASKNINVGAISSSFAIDKNLGFKHSRRTVTILSSHDPVVTTVSFTVTGFLDGDSLSLFIFNEKSASITIQFPNSSNDKFHSGKSGSVTIPSGKFLEVSLEVVNSLYIWTHQNES